MEGSRRTELHPAQRELLGFFDFEHLREPQRGISAQFANLAQNLAYDDRLGGAELTVALRKLLEAKDCAVRASLDPPDPD